MEENTMVKDFEGYWQLWLSGATALSGGSLCAGSEFIPIRRDVH